VWARFLADRPQQVTRAEMRTAERERLKALRELTRAEQDLHKVRKDGDSTRAEIHAAERDVRQARTASARATESLTRLRRRDTAARAPVDLGGYIADLRKSADRTERWRRDLVKIARRAGSEVAEALEAMGAEGVRLVSKLADGSEGQLRRYARQTRRLAAPPQDLQSYTRQLRAEADEQAEFTRYLARLARRGQADVARHLADLGGEEGLRLARQAARDPAAARRLLRQLRRRAAAGWDDAASPLAANRRGQVILRGESDGGRGFYPTVNLWTLPAADPRTQALKGLEMAVSSQRWG
jgi:hypothetical protein